MDLNHKNILIVGFAREGQASLRFLQRVAPECTITLCDSRHIEGHNDLRKYSGPGYLVAAEKHSYDLILRSPGIPPETILAIFPNSTIRTATSLFLEYAPGLVIGVTGTKGKSTTASLITHLLTEEYDDVRLVGNIGKPALDYLELSNSKTIFVCELSSFQLEDVVRSPHTAVLLPVVPEHLDHHGSFESYVLAKYNIFKFQTKGSALVLDSDRLPMKTNVTENLLLDVKQIAFWKEDVLYIEEKPTELRAQTLRVRGSGALENICYAVAVVLHHEVPQEKVLSALQTFNPLPHRLEIVACKNGITYVNDSLCTVPEALINALDAFEDSAEVLIAGGHDRGIQYDVLTQPLVLADLKAIILFHGAGEKIQEVALKAGVKAEILYVNSMQEAVILAAKFARPGGTVLLSPAASSFGLFKDYVDRAEQFIKAVELIEQD